MNLVNLARIFKSAGFKKKEWDEFLSFQKELIEFEWKDTIGRKLAITAYRITRNKKKIPKSKKSNKGNKLHLKIKTSLSLEQGRYIANKQIVNKANK